MCIDWRVFAPIESKLNATKECYMKTMIFPVIALLFLEAVGPAARGNMVANGNFSSGTAGWTIAFSGNTIAGNVTSDGQKAVISGFLGSVTLSQSIATIPGAQYEVTFTLEESSAFPWLSTPAPSFGFANSSGVLPGYPVASNYTPTPDYIFLQSYDFIATTAQSSTVLGFYFNFDDNSIDTLANVSVNAVPDRVWTAPLLLLAAGCCWFAGRQRHGNSGKADS